jgi:hypothetical protein
MAHFGEMARIDSQGSVVRATLKSGTVVELNRYNASDFDDGLRVWDAKNGVVNLDSLRISSVEFLPTPPLADLPVRLFGTVHSRRGDFTGFIGWDRDDCVGSDELNGVSEAGGSVGLRYDTLRSIKRFSSGGATATRLDGSGMDLSGTNEVNENNQGIYVDDPRYGKVRIDWDVFERVEFSPAGSGPAYGDFPPGSPLTGRVTTRAGSTFAGRIAWDLDENETTDTLDAGNEGLYYTLPFGLIASITPMSDGESEPDSARVMLRSGEELKLAGTSDVSEGNAGVLVVVEGREQPEYVPWKEIERVEFDRPAATYLPAGGDLDVESPAE